MWQIVIDFLHCSLIGNIVGILSLIAGIVGIVITVKTMKKAEIIEIEIKSAKKAALDKMRFNKKKESYKKKLKSKRKAVANNGMLSYSMCNDVLSIINDLLGHETVISKTDMEKIITQKKELVVLSFSLKSDKNNNNNLQKFDEIVAIILNILIGNC